MISDFPKVLNFDRLFLKLDRFPSVTSGRFSLFIVMVLEFGYLYPCCKQASASIVFW